MQYLRTTAAALALLVGTAGCFVPVPTPPWRVDQLEEEHRDRHIEVRETAPPPERECWRHGDHWHCHRDDD